MNEDYIISKIEKFAFENSEKDDIHGFSHVKRVLKLTNQLGSKLSANLTVLRIATLLHDIGRENASSSGSKKNHAELSAEMAEAYLKSQKFNITKDDLENIIHCIKSHSFSNNSKPHTLEGTILSDADKLDAIGAIGLYRTIGFTIKNGGDLMQVIDHLKEKILKLKDKMYLEESKLIAEERHRVVELFMSNIKEELKNSNSFLFK